MDSVTLGPAWPCSESAACMDREGIFYSGRDKFVFLPPGFQSTASAVSVSVSVKHSQQIADYLAGMFDRHIFPKLHSEDGLQT